MCCTIVLNCIVTIGIQTIAQVFFREVLRRSWQELLPPGTASEAIFAKLDMNTDVVQRMRKDRDDLLKSAGNDDVVIEVVQSRRTSGRTTGHVGGASVSTGSGDGGATSSSAVRHTSSGAAALNSTSVSNAGPYYRIVADNEQTIQWWKWCCFQTCDNPVLSSQETRESVVSSQEIRDDDEDEEESEYDDEEEDEDDDEEEEEEEDD